MKLGFTRIIGGKKRNDSTRNLKKGERIGYL
jgi:hypothetical protein